MFNSDCWTNVMFQIVKLIPFLFSQKNSQVTFNLYLIHVMRYKQHIYSTTSSELIIMVFWSNISTYTVVLLLVEFYFDSHEQLDFEWRVQFDCIDSNIKIDVRRMKYKAKDIILWYNTVNIHPIVQPLSESG